MTVMESLKNYAEAARLAKLSADQGDGYGEAVLGTLYKDGHGVRLVLLKLFIIINSPRSRESRW